MRCTLTACRTDPGHVHYLSFYQHRSRDVLHPKVDTLYNYIYDVGGVSGAPAEECGARHGWAETRWLRAPAHAAGAACVPVCAQVWLVCVDA